MGRKPCCSKEGLNRGAWTSVEDKILVSYIKEHGEGKWGSLPMKAGLKRCGKSCRLRWLNYLRPGIKRGNISDDEEELIIRLHKLLGNRWSLIAGRLPGRTDNEIKNYWNTTLCKKHQGRRSSHEANHQAQAIKLGHKSSAKTKPNIGAQLAKQDSSPIQTKALRCSRAYFIQDPRQSLSQVSAIEQNVESVAKHSESEGEVVVHKQDFLDDGLIDSVDFDLPWGFQYQFGEGVIFDDHDAGTFGSPHLENFVEVGETLSSFMDLQETWF